MFFKKDKTALERLKNHEFENMKEKLELIQLILEEEKPDPTQCIWMLTDTDMKIREIGTKIIPQRRGAQMFQLLLDEIRQKGANAKKHILPMLILVHPEGLFSYLLKSASNKVKEERLLALEIMSQFSKMDRFLDVLSEMVQDPEEEIRYLAANKLTPYIHNKDIFLLFVTLLQDTVDRIRHLAIHTLAKSDNPEIIQPFFERMSQEPEEIQNVIVAALGQLAQHTEEAIIVRILPVLADESADNRKIAAKLLAQMPNKKMIVRRFLKYTRGVAFWLRDRIFESMGTISYHIADTVLELLQDDDMMVRIDSIFLAAYIKDERVIPGVVSILNTDADWWIRISAIDILVKFRPPKLIQTLQKYHDDSDLKWSIISAYGELKEAAALDYLKSCLKDPLITVRLASVRALAKFDLPQTWALVDDIATHERNWLLRTEAQQLLEDAGKLKEMKAIKTELDKKNIIAELMTEGICMDDDNLNMGITAPAEAVSVEELSQEIREQLHETTDGGSHDTSLPLPQAEQEKSAEATTPSTSQPATPAIESSLAAVPHAPSAASVPKRPLSAINPPVLRPKQDGGAERKPTTAMPAITPAAKEGGLLKQDGATGRKPTTAMPAIAPAAKEGGLFKLEKPAFHGTHAPAAPVSTPSTAGSLASDATPSGQEKPAASKYPPITRRAMAFGTSSDNGAGSPAPETQHQEKSPATAAAPPVPVAPEAAPVSHSVETAPPGQEKPAASKYPPITRRAMAFGPSSDKGVLPSEPPAAGQSPAISPPAPPVKTEPPVAGRKITLTIPQMRINPKFPKPGDEEPKKDHH